MIFRILKAKVSNTPLNFSEFHKVNSWESVLKLAAFIKITYLIN